NMLEIVGWRLFHCSIRRALHKKSWAVIDRPYSLGCATVGALYEAVNELMTRNSPPKLGGEPARTKSEQAGWFPCRYWQLREPPRPRLRSGTPPNLGGECPRSNSFTAPMTADNTAICEIAGGHRPPLLQWPFSTFCAKPRGEEYVLPNFSSWIV